MRFERRFVAGRSAAGRSTNTRSSDGNRRSASATRPGARRRRRTPPAGAVHPATRPPRGPLPLDLPDSLSAPSWTARTPLLPQPARSAARAPSGAPFTSSTTGSRRGCSTPCGPSGWPSSARPWRRSSCSANLPGGPTSSPDTEIWLLFAANYCGNWYT
ncbi:protein SPT2 homolog [Triticum dicoccoides]|uniref:protein SPT2 homolog n=1 Tax=Triticum dicoccoides TaxID=85692 RepID=UPI0018908BBF|nr:protein SPT2 homolog [Triticum dicoccoides]XP_044324130.1 protein SPT2 homolog [Triticum aestivum]